MAQNPNNPNAHLTESVQIAGYTQTDSVTASIHTSRIDCVESEIMELYAEYEWTMIRSIEVNGEEVDFEYDQNDGLIVFV
jgi:hypothetical protein|tara:strand:+ start:360 stop:599 length:240 start_codon:yes stop_codon:yes gene_type:complete